MPIENTINKYGTAELSAHCADLYCILHTKMPSISQIEHLIEATALASPEYRDRIDTTYSVEELTEKILITSECNEDLIKTFLEKLNSFAMTEITHKIALFHIFRAVCGNV